MLYLHKHAVNWIQKIILGKVDMQGYDGDF